MAEICLAGPDAEHCVTQAMAEELRDACRLIGEDDECRLVTLSATGDCFSVGRTQAEDSGGGLAEGINRLKAAQAIAALPMPVIVVVQGDAIGHGLELALAGDIRIASTGARFGLWERGMPAMPFDGGTQRLPRLVGPAMALDMALTGRQLTAEEALQVGLVNRVAAPGQLAAIKNEMVEQVLKSGPIAARYVKEAVGKGMDLTLEQGLRLEADLSVILQSTADRAEGIASFVERRDPNFRGA